MRCYIPKDYKLPPGRSLGLKVVYEDGRPEFELAPEGFLWNLTPGGETEAPDWNSTPECGGGLHIWSSAQGDLSLSRIWGKLDAVWVVVEYNTADAVCLEGCVKVPRCKTVAFGQPHTKYRLCQFVAEQMGVQSHLFMLAEGAGRVEVGDGGYAVSTDGVAVAGWGGLASGLRAYAGPEGTAYGKVEAVAGDWGTASVGDGGEARVGFGGRAKAGEGGSLAFLRRFPESLLTETLTFKVGGDSNVLPDVYYHLDPDGSLVKG